MTTKASFIWDLDGTLFDSYPAIVPSAREICAEAGVFYEESYVRDFVLRTSVNDLLRQVAEEKQLAFEPLKAAFNARSDSRWASIQAIPHARETLASLQAAGERDKLVFLHYPPVYQRYECPEILELLERYEVKKCFYGHIHGKGIAGAFNGWRGRTEFRIVSADAVGFAPAPVFP